LKIIIEAINTPEIWQLGGTTAKLRIYANQSFQTSLGQWWPQGTPGAQNTFYLEVPCTILAGELTIPSFEIDSTVDALINPFATYTAELISSKNKRVLFLSDFAVNTLEDGDPSTTWGEIALLRDSFNPQTVPDSLIRQLISQIQLAVGNLNKASETNTGVTALSTDPIDPTFPIAVSTTDPIWQELVSGSGEERLSFTFDGTELWDNAYWEEQVGYHRHSPMARVVFETEAASVDIDVFASTLPDSGTAIQVLVNGVVHATPVLAAITGEQTITQALPEGKKTVTIVAGVQALIAGSVVGVYLLSCEFDVLARLVPPAAPARLLAYGDSTSQGGGGGGLATNLESAWPTHFRQLSTRSVVVEAASGRALWDDANTPELRTAFVAKLVAANPEAIWFLIGTNDYNASKWSAADFGTAYAATIDGLHTALPNIKIYCQTPLFKFAEFANAFGNLEEDYREQIRAICRDRSVWAILVEGPAVLSQTEMLSEGGIYIHPNDLGNRNLALFVDNRLNGNDATRPQADYGVTEDVIWTNTANVAVASNSLSKNAGLDGVADAGGSSTRAVAGSGVWSVEFTTTETNKIRLFGVSSINVGTDLANVRYGFAPQPTGLMALWQDGAGYSTGGQIAVSGDRYIIRSDGTNIYYERIRDGVVTTLRKAATPLIPSVYPLYVQGIILGSGGTITNAKIHGILV
jgi:hypothetical protein